MKKSYIVTLGLSLLIGCFLGIEVGRTVVDGLGLLNKLSASSAASEYAFRQYLHADHENAREALVFSVRFLDDLDALYPERTLKFDVALSYARLALLEEAAGNREQSRAYFQKAQNRFKVASMRNKEYSEADVRKVLEKFDGL